LTSKSIADCIKRDLKEAEVVICGGGRLNKQLMDSLEIELGSKIKVTEDYGVDGDFLEAGLCAWVAY
jgi:1,6-anhydro-N-acetylmuramate kinase